MLLAFFATHMNHAFLTSSTAFFLLSVVDLCLKRCFFCFGALSYTQQNVIMFSSVLFCVHGIGYCCRNFHGGHITTFSNKCIVDFDLPLLCLGNSSSATSFPRIPLPVFPIGLRMYRDMERFDFVGHAAVSDTHT